MNEKLCSRGWHIGLAGLLGLLLTATAVMSAQALPPENPENNDEAKATAAPCGYLMTWDAPRVDPRIYMRQAARVRPAWQSAEPSVTPDAGSATPTPSPSDTGASAPTQQAVRSKTCHPLAPLKRGDTSWH